jgi:hypothetical protein
MISNKKAMKRSILRQVVLLAGFFTLSMSFYSGTGSETAILLTRSEQYDKAGEMLQDLIKKEPSNAVKITFTLVKTSFWIILQIQYPIHWQLQQNPHRKYFRKVLRQIQMNLSTILDWQSCFPNRDDSATADQMRSKARSFLLPYKK